MRPATTGRLCVTALFGGFLVILAATLPRTAPGALHMLCVCVFGVVAVVCWETVRDLWGCK